MRDSVAIRSLILLLVISCMTEAAVGQVEVSLPDGGAYRASMMMPVGVKLGPALQSNVEVTIVADGALVVL